MAPRGIEMAAYGSDTLSPQRLGDSATPSFFVVDGAERPRESPTDLNRIIAQIVRQHQTQAAAAGLTLSFAPSANLPLVMGDCHLLAQMLEALVLNALRHTRTGWIKIITSYAPTAAVVIVDVLDSSDGIGGAECPRIKTIAEHHRGTLRADSTPGLGSRYSVQLPSWPETV